MTKVFDSLPEPIRQRAAERAVELGLPANDHFLMSLIEDVEERRKAMDALILASLDSGPGVVADEAFWAERFERLRSCQPGEVTW